MSETPQLENGFTQIANEILEHLILYKIPGEQLRCLLFIIRKTYGWGEKSAEIPLKEFVEALGINKQSVSRSLKSLKDKNVIIVIKVVNRLDSTYGINKKYKEWEALPRLLTLPRLVKIVTKVGNEPLPRLVKEAPLSFSRNKKKEKKETSVCVNKSYTLSFEKFWEAYPNKKCGKANTFKSWNKSKTRPDIESLMIILEHHKDSKDWKKDNGQYIPMATTWINQSRWDAVLEIETKEEAWL